MPLATSATVPAPAGAPQDPAGPTQAHDDRGRIDPSAAVIRLVERLGRVHDVRRLASDRLAARRA
ncbi:hypothetical protein ACLQ2D_20460 [Streptomyces sp. DT199]|uniref:hypothetical protein n=1 Tax=Streptomyces TaxID=1883 RepID=UPI0033AC9EFA